MANLPLDHVIHTDESEVHVGFCLEGARSLVCHQMCGGDKLKGVGITTIIEGSRGVVRRPGVRRLIR